MLKPPLSNLHNLTFPNTESISYLKARYHYLLQILFGETMAIDYCQTMATFAPSKKARDYLLEQQKEEDSHLEILTDYVSHHPRPEVLITPYSRKLHDLMSLAIKDRDYVAAVFIQNFVIEGLNVSLLKEFEHHSDSVLSELCTQILKDEVRHTEFGVEEMRNILEKDQSLALRKKLNVLHRRTLYYSLRIAMDLGRESKYLGIPLYEFARKALDDHFNRITRAKFPLPYFDKIIFNLAITFLKIIR